MDPHEQHYLQLSREERQLLVLRDLLYGGSWSDLIKDLEDRKVGKPFIFKLQTRIDEDLKRIRVLMAYEAAHDVDLGRFAEEEGTEEPEPAEGAEAEPKAEKADPEAAT